MIHKKKKPVQTKKTEYLMFCGNCGFPQVVPIKFVKDYFPKPNVNGINCIHCYHLNTIPEHLKKLSDDL